MNRLIAGLMSAAVVLGGSSLSACNTLEGAGKDVERAGEKIQSANCTKEESKSDASCQK
ncbi:MAG: entericidin A/B family lipoprotein [Panacagrimonas sp.]